MSVSMSDGLSDYERKRLARIAENNAKLSELDLLGPEARGSSDPGASASAGSQQPMRQLPTRSARKQAQAGDESRT